MHLGAVFCALERLKVSVWQVGVPGLFLVSLG